MPLTPKEKKMLEKRALAFDIYHLPCPPGDRVLLCVLGPKPRVQLIASGHLHARLFAELGSRLAEWPPYPGADVLRQCLTSPALEFERYLRLHRQHVLRDIAAPLAYLRYADPWQGAEPRQA